MLEGRRSFPTLVGITLSLLTPYSSAGERPADRMPARYVVVLDDAVRPEAVESTARALIEAARATIPSLALARRMGPGDAADTEAAPERDVVFRHALKGFAVRLDAAAGAASLEALERDPRVAYVAEDRAMEIDAQLFQPNMERLRVRRAGLAAVNDVADVAVDADIAILDTGIDATHPDLDVFRSVSFVSGDPTTIDPHGHGTHLAGIAAAIDDSRGVFGVAPGARLWSVKVIGAAGVGSLTDVLSGLDYVMAHAGEIDVVNLSFGGAGVDDGRCGATVGDPLHQAVCALVGAGVVVVASAGNYPPYGRDASLVSPASYDEVITVSAVVETDGAGPRAGRGAGTVHGPDNAFARTFSNYGWDVDIAAPGVNVISTWPGGGWATQTGTSVAAAHVAGAAALWIAKNGKPANHADALRVRNELVRLGFPQLAPDEGFMGDKETYAEPLLNVGAIDLARFDPVEPTLAPDRSVYAHGQHLDAIVTVDVKNAQGLPFAGLTSNAFLAYLGGRQTEVGFQDLGAGRYSLTLDLQGLLPGDYDFTVLVRNVSGFQRSAGCRVVVRDPEPGLRLHKLAFYWPIMNHGFFFTTNPLHAALRDEKGAPVVVSPQSFTTVFSGGGPSLVWSYPPPDLVTGVLPGVTYGAYQTEVSRIDTLPLGVHHADVTVTAGGRSDAASASFAIAYHAPALTAVARPNLRVFDFTQAIPPPALDLTVEVRSEWDTGVLGLLYLVAAPFVPRIDGEAVAAASIVEIGSGVYSIRGVALDGLTHGPHQVVVRVTDGRGIEVHSNPVAITVLREAGPCADPRAGAGDPDADGDGIRDACDNCPTASNRSQRRTPSGDPATAGLGDACRPRPSLKVSSAAGDNPDFSTIQEAVDRAMVSSTGVRIEILPGAGPYFESVTIDRGQPFTLVGIGDGARRPVVRGAIDGRPVFDLRSAGAGSIGIHDLVLRGDGATAAQSGIRADGAVSADLSDLRFERLGMGVELRGGAHRMTRIGMDGTVGAGVLAEDATATLEYAEIRGLGEGVRISGASAAVGIGHLLLVGNGGGNGIVNASSRPRSLGIRHSTLVGWGTAVSGASGNTTIAHSILWGNQAGMAGVACADVAWSNVQSAGCGGTNLAVDPSFVNPAAGDYRLQADSPLLDHGPDPASYAGVPCVDLDGGPRLRDHDGDRWARIDPGVYERRNASMRPEVTGVVWSGPATLRWNAEPSAVEYHVYRALLSALAYSAFGVCADALDTRRNDTIFTDASAPPAGDGFYYQVTAEDAAGQESTLGVGTCAERSNFASCP